jgi:hypothetical protein
VSRASANVEDLRPLVRDLQFLQIAGELDGIGAIITAYALRVSGRLDDAFGAGALLPAAIGELGHDDDPDALAVAGALVAAQISRMTRGTPAAAVITAGSEPTVTCDACGDRQTVVPDGRGFPPDIAKNKLRKRCRAKGCAGEPQYRAGISPGLARQIGGQE